MKTKKTDFIKRLLIDVYDNMTYLSLQTGPIISVEGLKSG